MLAHTITPNTVSVLIDGEMKHVSRQSPHVARLLQALTQGNVDGVRAALDLALGLKLYSDDLVEIRRDGAVLYKGELLPEAVGRKVFACYTDGVPFNYLLKFFERLDSNPSNTSREQLYRFLDHHGLCITPDGKVLGYKGVGENYWSITGNTATKVLQGRVNDAGQIYNGIGETIEVARHAVCDDPSVACAAGAHLGSCEYAKNWGPRVVIVEFDPADAVSVPHDCSCQKLRTCKYRVVADFKGELSDSAVADAENPYKSKIVLDSGYTDKPDPDEDLEVSGEIADDEAAEALYDLADAAARLGLLVTQQS
jgi:hypothetical protein